MKPLLVLLTTFALAVFTLRLIRNEFELALPARIAMSCMLLFTAMAHFAFTKGMTMMIPDFIPYKKELVYLTGLIEIFAAAGLLIPGLRIPTAWLLILFFIALLPANIHAAARHIDYQKANFEGIGLNYLWFRVPLQVLFILWTYISAIRL
jgi:uncharacterized membrane protein